MNNNDLTASLLNFLDASPTPLHAVQNMASSLDSAGFELLDEASEWTLQPRRGYYTIRGGSSIVAFTTAEQTPMTTGIRMVGAHTDSPCLKIKPRPEKLKSEYFQLGVEVYGGVLLNPWFDRDLSIAGQTSYLDAVNRIHTALIDFQEPIAVIPSLAIHLDRDVNNSRSINPQQQLPIILSRSSDDGENDLRKVLLDKLKENHPEQEIISVLDFDLSLYDTQPAQIIGIRHEFIASARLDNLVSCFTGLRALTDCNSELPCLLVCNDHEEVGSQSAIGAQGPFLRSILQRWCGSVQGCDQAVHRSILISADNAHAIHPNFPDKHDSNHGPLLNKGPVIKVNHNQRYATNSVTSSIYRNMCDKKGIPVQVFVSRSDMACGSTIGPLTAGELGVQTLDLGIPQFAMHSIRELCGADDVDYLYRSLIEFFNVETLF